jgi:NAD-dependent DNA ligase
VTKHTSYLVVGEKPGSEKLEKAKLYNIPVISGEELENKLGI